MVTRLGTYCKGSAVSNALYSSQWHMFGRTYRTDTQDTPFIHGSAGPSNATAPDA